MYFVYCLRSKISNWHYIGLTDNVDRRINEHEYGWVKKTRNYRPFQLIHVEIFNNRSLARKFEKYFKSGFGRENLAEIEIEH